MSKYEVVYHSGVGKRFVVDVASYDEAAEVTRDPWIRGEGYCLYEEVQSVEINLLTDDGLVKGSVIKPS